MARYEIVFHNGYGREIDSMTVEAASMAVALTLSGNLLLAGAVRNGEQASSAAVEQVGVYDQERYECTVDESAGMAELHSVRSELHEIDRPDVGRAERLAAELRAELADPLTGTED